MRTAAFNLRHLRALTATVKSGSLSAAASALGISQPAVSQAISRLEALTGTRLLERSTGGVSPTDGGLLLAARGEAASAAIASAFQPYRSGGTGARPGADQDISMAQLTALISLADGGSYAAGAAAAGIAQPSLHRAVADLERLCGIALAERRGRGVQLTEAGQRLASAFRLAAGELQAAMDELAVLGGRDQGAIRIAGHPAALERLLPRAVARFLAEHPPVVIEMEEAGKDQDLARLRDGRLDALVVPQESDLAGNGLEVIPLLEDPLAILARAGHPLAGTRPGLVRLATFGWALPPKGRSEREAWERMFLAEGVYPPAASVTCQSSAALLTLVSQSDLLTVASAALVEDRIYGGLVRIGDALGGDALRLVLVTRSGWAPTPAQAAFLEELRACARQVLAF